MKISDSEKRELESLYSSFFNNEKIRRLMDVPMHRGSNTFIHSFKVAKLAVKRGLRHKSVDLKKILVASVLHDYYLYDWRSDRSKLKGHGKNHPYIAAKNAADDFDIDKDIVKIIKSHMWPINFKEFPNSKEARIVNLADDHIALKEGLCSVSFKAKRRQKYMDDISHLFS